MKSKIDWFFLRRTLIFLLVAVVFSVAIVFLGWEFEDAKHEEYQHGAENLRTTHRLYKNMVNDIDLLEQYTTKYTDFKATGLVGGERRLSWIESLESTNSVLKLPQLSYRLLPQEEFAPIGLKTERNVQVKSSPMELDMSLLHEEDLFALLDGLSLSISNLFTVDSCNISLQGAVGRAFDTKKPNLKAHCVVRWIGIDAKS